MILVAAAIVLVLALSAWLMTRSIGAPLRRLAAAIGEIAAGRAGISVPDRGRGDEIGRIAEAVEGLRGNVAEAFARSQMIEQMPVGVMVADPNDAMRITYANAYAVDLAGRIESRDVGQGAGHGRARHRGVPGAARRHRRHARGPGQPAAQGAAADGAGDARPQRHRAARRGRRLYRRHAGLAARDRAGAPGRHLRGRYRRGGEFGRRRRRPDAGTPPAA